MESNTYILAKLLGYAGISQADKTADLMIQKFGGKLSNVFDADINALLHFDNMTKQAAVLIKLIPDCLKMYNVNKWNNTSELKTTADRGYYMADYISSPVYETFYMMCLDQKGNVINIRKISEGDVASAGIDIRRAVEFAVNSNAFEVIMAHNHPSGELHYSEQDLITTKHFQKILNRVGIRLADHFIVDGNEYMSMRERGILD